MAVHQSDPAFSELYSAYAAGCLDPAFALLVETQAALREDIGAAVAVGEMIAGVQLEAEAPADMRPDAVDRALAAIDALEPQSPVVERAAAEAAGRGLKELLDLPAPVREPALEAAGERGWRRAGNGLHRLSLDIGSAAETELFRIDPGMSVPRHSHSGAEFTLVLSGGFTDEMGSHGPGDLSVKGPDDTHQPVADADGPCLVLAVRDGGLRFTGMMGVIQRLFD